MPENSTSTFTIDNLRCASCVALNERTLKKIPGVREATVNFATGQVVVSHDGTVAEHAMHQVVAANGYHAAHEPAHTGHNHAQMSAQAAKKRAIGALVVAVPLLILAMVPLGIPEMVSNWIQAPLASLVILWIGREFHTGMTREIKNRAPGMDTLVSFGTLVALLWSWYALLAGSGHMYFETGAIIVAFILLGRFLEAKSRGQASAAIEKLMQLGAKVAHRMNGHVIEDVPVELVVRGDILQVKPGEKIPVDGSIKSGDAGIDESMLTGESMPSTKHAGDAVYAATLVTNSVLEIEATGVGKDTMLAQIVQMVANAQTQKAPIQKLADRVSGIFVPVVLAVSVITFAVWLFVSHDIARSIEAAVAVLVIACPCALGLATPTAMMVGTGMGAKRGILIKNGESLERAKQIDVVIFDKTGTLTQGKPVVTDVAPQNGISPDDVLRLAASLEMLSEHPLGRAIIDAAKLKHLELAPVEKFSSVSGKGLRGMIAGQEILVGNPLFVEEQGVTVYGHADVQRLQAEAKTTIAVVRQQELLGVIAIADTVKPEAKSAVTQLRAAGITVVMLTGDNQQTAEAIAGQLGITHVIAHVLPDGKAVEVKKFQQSGKKVVFVGDGINDAPALAQADLGVAVGTGTDIAIEAGNIVLVQGSPLKVVESLWLARRTFQIIRQNLFWAFVYNVVSVPIAAFGLLNPMIASAAMALSSVSVVGNSLRISRTKK